MMMGKDIRTHMTQQEVGTAGEKTGQRCASRLACVCFLVCLFILVVGCAPIQDTQNQSVSGTELSEANQLYESGVYDEAVQRYQAIVDAGVADGAVFYNLGNAHFKGGDLGRAILNYRRAQNLLPRDTDIRTNLQLARAQTRDRLEREGSGLVDAVTYFFVGWSTTDEVALAALVCWLLLCGCAVVALRWHQLRRVLRWIMVIISFGLVLSLLSLGIRFVSAQQPEAVVVAASVDVHSGPGTDYLVEFSLHNGAEVRVLEQRSAWERIALPGNLQGWVPDEAIEGLAGID